MFAAGKKYKPQIINAALRLLPMGAKLLLALYMGRFFDLGEIGTYGLVLGAVTILGVVLGQDLIYVVSREIVGEDTMSVIRKMRDQALHYGLNYLVLAIVIFGLIVTHSLNIPARILIYTLILTALESLGTVTYCNMNSLNQQILANGMFAIRSGIWIFPVLLLCMINPAFRTADTLLVGWIIGAAVSLAATLWYWRHYPWRMLKSYPVDWQWIKRGIKRGAPIWFGMIGLNGGMFIDRFVVGHFMTIDDVGVLTFYFSFTNALLALMQSGVMAFALPRMIKHHRDGAVQDFHVEARKTSRHIALGAGVAAIGIGIAVPIFAYLFQRPELIANTITFWLMLFGTWLRANSETYFNILSARHQDRAVWVGNLLFLIPALGGNMLFVPFFGFVGVGLSAIVASAFILAWRRYHVRSYMPVHTA